MIDKLKEILTHPLAAAGAGASAFMGVLDPATFSAILLTVWEAAPQLFTFGSIAGLTLPQFIPELEQFQPVFVVIVVVSGAAYLARLGSGIWEQFQENYDR